MSDEVTQWWSAWFLKRCRGTWVRYGNVYSIRGGTKNTSLHGGETGGGWAVCHMPLCFRKMSNRLCLVRYGPQWQRNSQGGDDLTERGGLSLEVRYGSEKKTKSWWDLWVKPDFRAEPALRGVCLSQKIHKQTFMMVSEHPAGTVLSYRDSLAVYSCLVSLPKCHSAERLFLNLEETWQADLFHLSFFLVLLLREELWNKICRKQISKWKTPEINCREGEGDWFRERLTFIIIIIRWT